jgi:dipeptidyl aminopeptidase/acylaminoacyl peptidase
MQGDVGKIVTRVVAGALGLAALGAGGAIAGAAAFAAVTLNERIPPTIYDRYTFTPFETNIPGFEEITLTTEDGLTLHGWWLPHPAAQQTVIGLGGHRSPGADMLGIGSGLWRAGFNVLLFDWRSRGRSPVAQHSLAYYEVRDAQAALDYAAQREPHASIGLIGFSMGAVIAIILAAADPRVRAVVADSPFTSIRDVVASATKRLRLPIRPVVALADLLTGWRYGYRFEAIRAIDVAPAIAPRPLLLIHGSADSVVPVEHSYRIAATIPNTSETWVIDGAEHCGAYFDDRPAYVRRVASFFTQHMTPDHFIS